ncbi:nucleotide exchange factor GrpE [Amaricoccus sp.]|uniref:nucleotide exchange factor GrpE n=1 Tax=Amaricoccus sp. TaxID=1872485 RepID=UPI001B5B2882|nr:nucleotide exchange factor GrpE [Amaricoccus sp.]MBP7240610.1 nucleotide exchange factor GrpE [Amaricoccus sp.]
MTRDRKTEDLEDRFLDDIEAEFDDAEEPTEAEVEADEIAALKAEAADLKDRLLRALAETENLRKRAERDRRDAEVYGATRLARDLLPVYDNFARALDSATDAARDAAPGLLEGIELTQRALVSALERNKIVRVDPQPGERFDPNLHQAMFEAPAPGTKAGEIIQVMSEGFTIGERLLRPAQVGVSSGGPAVPKPNGS